MAQAATPLPASTVVLVRPDSDGRFEVFFNRRPEQMDTYAGVYVFPGGRVDKSDATAEMQAFTRGISAVEARQKLGIDAQPEDCLAYWIAAARELFEEAGIHFFYSAQAAAVNSLGDDISKRLTIKRPALQRGEIKLPELLSSERLYCDVGRLKYFFHRVTPEHYTIRFDTRFFLAALPDHQVPLHSSEEVTESLWFAPAAALARAEAGSHRMMPPTLAVLHILMGHGTWSNLCDAFALAELPEAERPVDESG